MTLQAGKILSTKTVQHAKKNYFSYTLKSKFSFPVQLFQWTFNLIDDQILKQFEIRNSIITA